MLAQDANTAHLEASILGGGNVNGHLNVGAGIGAILGTFDGITKHDNPIHDPITAGILGAIGSAGIIGGIGGIIGGGHHISKKLIGEKIMSTILTDIDNLIQEMEDSEPKESLGKKILKHAVNIGIGAAIGAGAAHLVGGSVAAANAAGAGAAINSWTANPAGGAITGGILTGANTLRSKLSEKILRKT